MRMWLNTGALIIKIESWDTLCSKHTKKRHDSIGNYFGPSMRLVGSFLAAGTLPIHASSVPCSGRESFEEHDTMYKP